VIHLIVLHASVGITSFDALVTLLAKNEYKYVIAVPLAIGITNAVRALALMIGPLLIGNWVNKERLFYIFIFQGVSIILWGVFQSNFYVALIAVFFTGFTTTTIWSITYAFIQENVEQRYLGRVISYNDMIFMLSNVITTLFIGLMASLISLDIITLLLGVAFFAVAWYYKRIKSWI
jgi:MFS family permease